MAQSQVRSARSPPPLQQFPLGMRHCINTALANPLSHGINGIKWDMRYKEPNELSINDLAVAATQPSVPIMHLYFPSLPNDVRFAIVKPYGKAAWWDSERILEYVTLGDVFMAIFDHLRVPLTEGSLKRMGTKRIDYLGTYYVFSCIVPTDGEIAQSVSRDMNAPVYTVNVRKAG